jgi:hypothetical protein
VPWTVDPLRWFARDAKMRRLAAEISALSDSNRLELGTLEWDDEARRRSNSARLLNYREPPLDEAPSLVPQRLICPTFCEEEC